MSVYLDYNASSPIDSRVIEEMMSVYQNKIGNANSRTHLYGEACKSTVEESRKVIASMLGVKANEVIFTSGATESNNLVLQGLMEYGIKNHKKHVITTAIEHKSILETAKYLERNGFEVEYVKPNSEGIVDANDVLNRIKEDTLLVSVMHANNETGMIQPVKEIGDVLATKDVLFHIDATQTCGKLVQEVQELNYNFLSLSSHKMQGPQGIGALVVKKKSYRYPPLQNIMYGGPQEYKFRPGTTPVALAAGFAKACELAAEYETMNKKNDLERKQLILDMFDQSKVKYQINGTLENGMPNTLNVSIDGVSSEAIMLKTKEYCALSNGSACNANDYALSYVLTAMGYDEDRIRSSIRISWGPDTDLEELRKDFEEFLNVAKMMQ